MEGENEKLISIDELIERAKKLGIDFGKGNPRNRLRYYAKLGLIPPAKRKSFDGSPPVGAYPESVLKTLFEIDRKIKEGKEILMIKKELENEKKEKLAIFHPFENKFHYLEEEVLPKKIDEKLSLLKILKFVLLLPFLALGLFFVIQGQTFKNDFSFLLSSLSSFLSKEPLFVQAPLRIESENPSVSSPFVEPYLTINAETVIAGPLTVKDKISAPTILLGKETFKGNIVVAPLSRDQTYTFPDQSGTVCLTTGNCVGLGGEAIAVGGVANRIVKFISSTRIAPGSINDLASAVVVTITPEGRVGIGTERPRTQFEVVGDTLLTNLFVSRDLSVDRNLKISGDLTTPNFYVSGKADGKVGIKISNPLYDLHVKGRIQATGDICTDLEGGKCLSKVSLTPVYIGGGGGITGAGTSGLIPIWTGRSTLGNSILSQSGSTLDVAGTLRVISFQIPTGAQPGYVLTSDAQGFATWQPAPTGTLPAGSSGQTLRHNGISWVPNDFLYNTGSAIGIGTTSILATLTLAGNALFYGPLTINTFTLPQLILTNGIDSLSFLISSSGSEISTTKTLIFNPQTGEIKFWETTIKRGEYILRSSVPIFKFPIPGQTTSTSFVAVTKTISPTQLNQSLPPPFQGSQRKMAFLISFADNIPQNASSSWQISGPNIEFTFAGQNLSSLDEGVSHMSPFFNLPNVDWQLKVKVPNSIYTIRIFNIFLLIFDQIQ